MALLIPGDCLSVPFSFPNASIHNSCLWVSLQTLCSRDEWTGLFSGTGWLTISSFLFSKSYSSLQPFISVYEGGSTSMREQGRDLRSPWDEEDIPHSSCFFPSWFKHHQLQYRKNKKKRKKKQHINHLLCHFSTQPFSLLSRLFDSKGNETFYLM